LKQIKQRKRMNRLKIKSNDTTFIENCHYIADHRIKVEAFALFKKYFWKDDLGILRDSLIKDNKVIMELLMAKVVDTLFKEKEYGAAMQAYKSGFYPEHVPLEFMRDKNSLIIVKIEDISFIASKIWLKEIQDDIELMEIDGAFMRGSAPYYTFKSQIDIDYTSCNMTKKTNCCKMVANFFNGIISDNRDEKVTIDGKEL